MNESPDLKENEILKEFFTLEASLEGDHPSPNPHIKLYDTNEGKCNRFLECLHISLDIGGEKENTERD
jgi:hypothetical protein